MMIMLGDDAMIATSRVMSVCLRDMCESQHHPAALDKAPGITVSSLLRKRERLFS